MRQEVINHMKEYIEGCISNATMAANILLEAPEEQYNAMEQLEDYLFRIAQYQGKLEALASLEDM